MNDPRRITTKELLLSDIVTDAGTQVRATIDETAIANYAEAMEAGDKFPNVVTYFDGTTYTLADGFHRLLAAKHIGWEKMRVEIHQGTREDALLYACSANAAHGLPRTNADKRLTIKAALDEWPHWSDRQIAKACRVSHPLVADIRTGNSSSSTGESASSNTRLGLDAKTRKMPEQKQDEAKPEAKPPEETPRIQACDAAFLKAAGMPKGVTEPRVTEWYEAVERLVDDAIHTATDKQLTSMSVALTAAPRRIKSEIYRRKHEKKAA